MYRYAVLYSSLKSTRVPVRLYPEYLERAVRLAVEFHTSYRTSYFILHTSYFIFHISYFILHTSYFILHKSYLPVTEFQFKIVLHTSYFTFHISYFILHTSYFRAMSSCLLMPYHSSQFMHECSRGYLYPAVQICCGICLKLNRERGAATQLAPDRRAGGGKAGAA